MTRISLLALLAFVVTSACEPTGSTSGRAALQELPPEAQSFARDMVVASAIAEECSSISENQAGMDLAEEELQEAIVAKGLPRLEGQDVDSPAVAQRIQNDVFEYFQRNNILVSSPESYCAAGRKEIASGSRIGQFLVARG